MKNDTKKIRITLKIDIESEMENVPENDEDTLKYCIQDDLQELGTYNVYSCEIMK